MKSNKLSKSLRNETKKQHYFLGIDGGGTKTHALITDETGQALGMGRGGPANWESIGLDGLTEALKGAVGQALNNAGLEIEQINGAGMGLAGYDWPSQRDMILSAISPLGLQCPVEIVNDATLGIFAGTSEGWGVSVGSGTGCNCRGRSKDYKKEGRVVGGATEWSGEAAGGFDILLRAMRAVTFEWNRRGPNTALSGAFLQKTGARNLDELVEGVYTRQYDFDPSYIIMVFQIAAEGDPEALNVIRWAGDELGQMACCVIRQIEAENQPVEVILIGSVYDGHPLMAETLTHTVHEVAPLARIIRLNAPPVVGGALLGMEQILGQSSYTRRENLIVSTRAIHK